MKNNQGKQTKIVKDDEKHHSEIPKDDFRGLDDEVDYIVRKPRVRLPDDNDGNSD